MPGENWVDDLSRALAQGVTRKQFLRLVGLVVGAA